MTSPAVIALTFAITDSAAETLPSLKLSRAAELPILTKPSSADTFDLVTSPAVIALTFAITDSSAEADAVAIIIVWRPSNARCR